MIRYLLRILGALTLVAIGAGLQSLRAQGEGSFDGQFRHIGIVVRDVEASAKTFARVFGVTPTPIHTASQPALPSDYRGDPKAFVRTTELRTNNIEIHLLEPMGGGSPWREGLDKHGDGSLQHVSFGVVDLAGTITALERLGGHVTSGSPDSIYAYIEFPQLPFTVELEKVAP